ncbi:hypothetical protein CH296_00575 [Rhodococcus sp. 14-2496-1d]|uniref:DUF3263 domain-containing protein n=1 Tax=Rhodococcus sp. 14-2496-1d TaxID=2023146 RepID=UPI000B9C43FF|nr:DUF3263 domain-containing protein [Rhodococcus sp. 14-2496-1d]OZF40785.1 hypothetical protein CH296_00575 [Rhodococcus sp. 14-2496-1d]
MTPQQMEILAFEKRWYTAQGSKEADIAERFSLSPIRYYQLLNQLLDDPAALAAEPVLVKRLRRIRDERALSRRSAPRVAV